MNSIAARPMWLASSSASCTAIALLSIGRMSDSRADLLAITDRGKQKLESGPGPKLAHNVDRASVRAHDPTNHRESQTSARSFRREELIEDLGASLSSHTAAPIGDCQPHVLAGRRIGPVINCAIRVETHSISRYCDEPFVAVECFCSICDEINDNLPNLCDMATHRR